MSPQFEVGDVIINIYQYYLTATQLRIIIKVNKYNYITKNILTGMESCLGINYVDTEYRLITEKEKLEWV